MMGTLGRSRLPGINNTMVFNRIVKKRQTSEAPTMQNKREAQVLKIWLILIVALFPLHACGRSPTTTGQEILMSVPYQDDWEVAIFNLDEGILLRTTKEHGADMDPVWSPGSEQILMASARRDDSAADDRSGDDELFVLNREGSVVHQLTDNLFQDTQPDWSPDGKWISFKSDRTGRPEIFVMRSDGTQLRQLTNSVGENWSPDWSPDGGSLAFASNRNGNFDLFVMRADGSEVNQVTHSPADELEPIWSPTGNALSFALMESGDPHVLILDLDDGRITDTGVVGIPADWRDSGPIRR